MILIKRFSPTNNVTMRNDLLASLLFVNEHNENKFGKKVFILVSLLLSFLLIFFDK